MVKKRILIADDEEDILTMLERKLTRVGYAVSKAATGSDAVVKARDERPDLIILDISMPDMDGGDVKSVLKESPLTKDIPIIFLTGLLRKEEEKHRTVMGGSHFLAKPYNIEGLLELIKKHLGGV